MCSSRRNEVNSPIKRGLAESLLAVCGIWLIGLGLYFIFLRPAFLPEDLHYIGVEEQALRTVAPHLTDWLGKVFTVMGGFMAGAGLLTAYFAWCMPPPRTCGATAVLVVVGLSTTALMSAVNFALHSDFRWLLLAPPGLWAAAVLGYVAARRSVV